MEKTHARWAADDLGPAMVAFLRPCSGVEAFVVVDNTALGPAIGGVRMRPDVTVGGVLDRAVRRFREARIMLPAFAELATGQPRAGAWPVSGRR